MAVAKIKYGHSLPGDHHPVESITPPKQSTMTTNEQRKGLPSFLKYVEGHNWTVTYYGQLLNAQSSLNHFDPFQGDLSQSYVEIKDLVLKVQSPLSYSYDDNTGLGDMKGEALLPYQIAPMKGDVFTAVVEEGENVLFVVNEVSRVTHRSNSVFHITYNSFSYESKHPEYLVSLQKRIQESYHFDNRLDNGSEVRLITTDTKNSIDRLLDFMKDSKDYYFNSFIQQRTNAIGIPGLNTDIIDPILNEFINQTVDTSLYIERSRFEHEVSNRDYYGKTILDSLLSSSLPSGSFINRKVGFTNSQGLWRRSRLATVQFSKITYVAVPIDPFRKHQSNTRNVGESPGYDIRSDVNYADKDKFLIKTMTEQGHNEKLLLHDLFEEDHYIVSSNFYEYMKDNSKYADVSYMEVIIYKYLKGEVIDPNTLYAVISMWEEWSTLYQFYLLPVLWLIIKVQLGVL